MRLLLLLALLPAQDIQEGVYTHKKHGLTVTFPKDWTLEKGEAEFVLTFASADDEFDGDLEIVEETDLSAKKKAEEVEKEFKELEGVKDFKIEKDESLKKSPGEWLIREYSMELAEEKVRVLSLYVARDKTLFVLSIWAGADGWKKEKDSLYKIVNSFAFGEVKKEATGVDVEVPNPWKGCGKGSWAKHTSTSTNQVEGTGNPTRIVEVIYTLVDQDAESYTLRVDFVSGGNTIKGEPTKVMLKQKAVTGGDKPKVEEGEETVKTAKGEFKCKWVKTTTPQGWSKVWSSDDVPFRLVKLSSEMGPVSSTMELVDFEKK